MTLTNIASAAAALLLASFAVGCAGEPEERTMPGGDTAAVCVDADGDGFGVNCEAGPDCNDNDPAEAATCEPAPSCDEGAVKECKVYIDTGMEGVISCFNGVQICEGGSWGDCVEAGEV